ncbi:MAG: hypothetical protein JXR61_07440 [Prolixibacteraceae bacterium]|nr:hypothetical protein [Prolixibacteraceae bacterium]
MNIKINLTKKHLLNLALFVAILGAAALLDFYFDKTQVQLSEANTNSNEKPNEPNMVHLFSQLNSPAAKVELQKPGFKNLQPKLHDRLIQKYHQIRNHQLLKAEFEPKTSPMISEYRYVAFKNYFFSDPDDDHPLVS